MSLDGFRLATRLALLVYNVRFTKRIYAKPNIMVSVDVESLEVIEMIKNK